MDILLISPDHQNRKNNFPWGILSIGSYLTDVHKKEVVLLDASAYSHYEFRQKLNNLIRKVSLVGIGFFSTDIKYVKRLVDYIKNLKPGIKIVVGGPHATLEPEQTCAYKNIDFVVYANGELTTIRLIEELNKSKPNFDNIPGLVYKTADKLKKTEIIDFREFYDTNYSLLPETTQETFPEYIQVLTGRGCSYRCRFCYNSIVNQSYRFKTVEDVVHELETIINLYNPRIIYFRDEDFFQNKQRIIDFIRLYREKKFSFRWRATCRVNYFNEHYINSKVLKDIESINCETLKMGIESGSQRILNYLKKGIHINRVKHAVGEIAGTTGINGNYSFISGIPGQTEVEHIDTIKLIKFILKHEPNATIIGPQYFRIYPGGILYNEIIRNYNFIAPNSFEEYADTFNKNDQSGLNKEIAYPWVPKKSRYLSLYGDLLIAVYRMPLKKLFSKKGLFYMPFSLLARLRIKFNYYDHLFDFMILAKLYSVSNVIQLKLKKRESKNDFAFLKKS